MNDGKFRSLAWWQPYGTLMLPPYNKIETRQTTLNVDRMEYRKPPFPLGKYLIYTTQHGTPDESLKRWCTAEIYSSIHLALGMETRQQYPTDKLHGYAIGVGELMQVRKMWEEDEKQCFIQHAPGRFCLVFKDVKRIVPFRWQHGKQGVGFVPDSELEKIKYI